MSGPGGTRAQRLGAAWGLAGVVLILGDAVARVWPYTLDALRHGLSAAEWTVLAGWVLVMTVAEGYRGFQRHFVPRVLERAGRLRHHGHGVDLVLAPLYCIGYFHAPRRVLIGSYALTVGIVAIVVAVGTLDQPQRGIVDAGVLAGLTYGLLSLAVGVAGLMRDMR